MALVAFPYSAVLTASAYALGAAPAIITFTWPAAGSGTNFQIVNKTASPIPAASPWVLALVTVALALLGVLILGLRRGRSSQPR